MFVIGVLIHTVCALVPAGDVRVIVLFGLTVTVAVNAGPKHALAFEGVIVNVTVTGAAVILVREPLILPVPLAAIPVTATVLSLVQV